MKLIKPITYSDTQLISTNATESVAAYAAGTTYAVGAYVQYSPRIYQSLVASNVGNQPDISPTKWLDTGPDNKHGMFDTQVSTQTTMPTTITVQVKPGAAFNSLGLLNISGNSLVVTMLDTIGGTSVYSNTVSLDNTIILDWYMYFFEPYNFKTDVVLTDLPPYPNGAITATLTSTSTALIGSMVYGTTYDIGSTQYGATVGIRDYSTKTTDTFGNTTFVKRAYSKRMEAGVFVKTENLTFNYNLLASIRATPVVWIGSDVTTMQPLVMFGYYRDFTVNIQYPSYALCNLSIEGLI